jgi:hypothetical protein
MISTKGIALLSMGAGAERQRLARTLYYPETGVEKSAKTFLHKHNNSTMC